MPIHICPHCKERISIGFDTTDFVHECHRDNLAIDQEDVVVVGDWEDFSGSGSIPPQEVMRQGLINELQGRRAGIGGLDKEPKTRRGVGASTRRQRQHLQFIDLKGASNDQ